MYSTPAYHQQRIPQTKNEPLFHNNPKPDIIHLLVRLMCKPHSCSRTFRMIVPATATCRFHLVWISIVAAILFIIRIRPITAACPFAHVSRHIFQAPCIRLVLPDIIHNHTAVIIAVLTQWVRAVLIIFPAHMDPAAAVPSRSAV